MTTLTQAATVLRTRRRRRRSWPRIVAYSAAGVIVVVVLATLFAPLIAPHNPNAVDLNAAFSKPTGQYPLGADASGRDLLSRLLYGARPALLGPALAVLLATTAGTLLAVVAAWVGGIVDRILSRTVDVLFAFPGILLALLAAAMFGAGFWSSIIGVAVAEVPYIMRVIRTEALRHRSRPYMEGALVQGFSGRSIVLRHLLPNVLPSVFTQMTLSFGYVMINLASVSFLGLGIQPPTADWGAMVSEGESSLVQGYPQESLYAGAALVIVVVAFTLFGDYIAERAEARR
jgi:peptide/nickel transport system permease protein